MSTETPTIPNSRLVDGTLLPVAGTWVIDAQHSQVGFTVRHLMVGKTRGRFTAFTGAVTIAEDALLSSVAVTIEAASIDTRDEGRDNHLRSADFLDVEQFPTLTFTSTKVEGSGTDYRVTGDLTIRGITKQVVLDVDFEGITKDPWGNSRIGFEAETEIDREDFGLTWNAALETGGVLVGKKVKIEIEVEAVLQA